MNHSSKPKYSLNRNGKRSSNFIREITKNKTFYSMMLPGLLFIILMYYMPMIGTLIAFQDYNPIKGILGSKFVGLKNFEFFFKSNEVFNVTFNTIFYNVIFIVTGLGLALLVAMLLKETGSKRLSRFYNSTMLFPYLISWVVIQYVVFSLLSIDRGLINNILHVFGKDPVQWYMEPTYWRIIMPLAYIWKNVGYLSVIFVAGLAGISPEYYEASELDGASKFQQMFHITIPLVMPIVLTLFLLQAGKIFFGGLGDWWMFYNVPGDNGVLFSSTDVIDTHVYRALRNLNDVGMSSAIGFYQSVVGFVLVLASNLIVRKYDRDSALF